MSSERLELPGHLPAAYRVAGVSSFTEFLQAAAPHLLPGNRPVNGKYPPLQRPTAQ